MRLLKYMGTADERTFAKSDDYGGQLPNGVGVNLKFSAENNWVVDADEVGLSSEVVEVMIANGDVKDVTEAKKVPLNEHQKMFLGMKGSEDQDDVLGVSDSDDGDQDDDPDVSRTGSPNAGTTGTVGGSTPGRATGATKKAR